MRLGIVSDTHGALPDWVLEAFTGVDLIVHAGDVGSPLVLDLLEFVAPVRAVRGNTDTSRELSALPHHLEFDVADLTVLVVHELDDVRPLVAATPADIVITGHTHRPRIQRSGDTLFVNPGSASRSRGEGHSVALLQVGGGSASAEVVRR